MKQHKVVMRKLGGAVKHDEANKYCADKGVASLLNEKTTTLPPLPYVLYKLLKRLLLPMLIFLSHFGYSDQFHYHNFIIGDRAMGLGGAYGGIADDASATYYNPGGLAFALANDISGSANAFYSKKITYKETIAGQDFVENIGGSVPSFFGAMQRMDNVLKNLVFSFSIYSVDGELKDQDDLFSQISLGTSVLTTKKDGCDANFENILDRYHRTANMRASTIHGAIGFGYRIHEQLGFGIGASILQITELAQVFQDIRSSSQKCFKEGEANIAKNVTRTHTQNVRQQLTALGLEPILGIQGTLWDKLSFGFSVKLGIILKQKYELGQEIRSTTVLTENQSQIDENYNAGAPYSVQWGQVYQQPGNFYSDHPLGKSALGSLPHKIRSSLAYFFSPRLLFSFDLIHKTAPTGAEKIGGQVAMYKKIAVTDFALGTEYYISPQLPLRLGLFSNKDAHPKVSEEPLVDEHIDYLGTSVFLAWAQPNSQIGFGLILQTAQENNFTKKLGFEAKAQKRGAGQGIQNVEAQALTFTFSATHDF